MLSVLLWVLVGIVFLGVIVFPGKRKGTLPLSDRETMISDAACNIAAVSLVLTQMLFPIYGYRINPTDMMYGNYTWKNGFAEQMKTTLSFTAINYLSAFNNKPKSSVYAFMILTAVFCFFAGMSIYKNGLKIKHKIFLFLPLLVTFGTACWVYYHDDMFYERAEAYIKYEALLQTDTIVRYLCGAFLMIAILYGIYLLLKKLLKNELIPLILILILSFFAPSIRVINDGVWHDPVLRIGYWIFGPDIPLFPIGMIVMKYKDKILPKTEKGIIIHLASWLCAGGLSFYALSWLQFFLIKQAGLYPSDALTDVWYEGLDEKLEKLDKIYEMDSIPWLIFGLAVSMILLGLVLLIRTGNPLTKFFREHCYLITVFLFSRHVFFETSGYYMNLWTKTFGLPENWFIVVPFICFAVSVILAFLVKRFILISQCKNMI